MIGVLAAVFSAGQATPSRQNIDELLLLPYGCSVRGGISILAAENRKCFSEILRKHVLSMVGSVTADGVTMKTQGKHYMILWFIIFMWFLQVNMGFQG